MSALALVAGAALVAIPWIALCVVGARDLGVGEVLLAHAVALGAGGFIFAGLYLAVYGITGEWVTP